LQCIFQMAQYTCIHIPIHIIGTHTIGLWTDKDKTDYIHNWGHTYINTYMFVITDTNMYIYKDIYIYTRTHTYIHTWGVSRERAGEGIRRNGRHGWNIYKVTTMNKKIEGCFEKAKFGCQSRCLTWPGREEELPVVRSGAVNRYYYSAAVTRFIFFCEHCMHRR